MWGSQHIFHWMLEKAKWLCFSLVELICFEQMCLVSSRSAALVFIDVANFQKNVWLPTAPFLVDLHWFRKLWPGCGVCVFLFWSTVEFTPWWYLVHILSGLLLASMLVSPRNWWCKENLVQNPMLQKFFIWEFVNHDQACHPVQFEPYMIINKLRRSAASSTRNVNACHSVDVQIVWVLLRGSPVKSKI